MWLAAWVPDPAATFAEEVALRAEAAFNPEWIGKDPTRRLFLPRAVYDERIDPDNGIPSTYIVASEDRTIRPDWQRRMARERLGVEPIEIATGHCPQRLAA